LTERADQLHAIADEQIAELIDLASRLDDARARLPCPGREKLGDGTVAACAQHTADNYQRIAAFVKTSDQTSGSHQPGERGGHSPPPMLRGLRHGTTSNPEPGPAVNRHDGQYTADNVDLNAVVQQLSDSRAALRRITRLTDNQLDTIPPEHSFRFCDGQRTLEQVLASLLKHQRHQTETLRAAVA
jgi:hypothetical protein